TSRSGAHIRERIMPRSCECGQRGRQGEVCVIVVRGGPSTEVAARGAAAPRSPATPDWALAISQPAEAGFAASGASPQPRLQSAGARWRAFAMLRREMQSPRHCRLPTGGRVRVAIVTTNGIDPVYKHWPEYILGRFLVARGHAVTIYKYEPAGSPPRETIDGIAVRQIERGGLFSRAV